MSRMSQSIGISLGVSAPQVVIVNFAFALWAVLQIETKKHCVKTKPSRSDKPSHVEQRQRSVTGC